MSTALDVLEGDVRDRLPTRGHPRWLEPMTAVLTDDRFSDADWVFERKLDGIRMLAFRHGDQVRLLTRNRQRRNDTFPEVVDALCSQPLDDVVLDCEIVAFDGDVTSFSRLQGRSQLQDPERARASGIDVYAYVFDILHLDGHDLRGLKLRDRKRVLQEAVDFADPVRLLPHRNTDGEAYWRDAGSGGWEGVIAKRADAPYRASRSKDWLKFKCVARQEFVVGGFTEPKGSRVGFGALVVGYWEDDGERVLRPAGRVGTGYDDRTLRDLHERLAPLECESPPFDEAEVSDTDTDTITWVAPELVVEVGFTEWTHRGRLRHPRFLGVREDKDPEDVVRERPTAVRAAN